ncbi:MAG: PIN domain-containing protein [Pseudomonadota bacterium]
MTANNEIDLSNLLSPVVLLDTNVIRATKENSPPFQILVQLAKAKSVRVIIPEIVLEERRTQWREQFLKDVRDGKKALSALDGEHVISQVVSGEFSKATKVLDDLDIEGLSKERYERFISANGFEVRPMDLDDARTAWDWYFSGKPPFKEVKNRKDIPDAHILASAKSVAASAPETYFVVGDKAMFDAASQMDGLTAFDTIDELISSQSFSQLRKELETEKKWQKLKALVSDASIKEHVAKHVEDYGDELLQWQDVYDQEIPEDNHTATVRANGFPSLIDVGDVQDWGAGFLRCPVTFNIEALLQFMVFRGDAFDVPDWVSVSIGDIEKEQYFDAEGYKNIDVSVDVSVRIDLDELSKSGDGEIFEVEFEEASLELSLSD